MTFGLKAPTSDFVDDEDVTEDENDTDVVIIGAGLTGLVCAYNILRKSSGLEVLVFEAKSDVGGRLLTQQCSETYFASFSQKYVTRLVQGLNLKRFSSGSSNAGKKILYTKDGPIRNLPRVSGAEVYSFFQTLQEGTGDICMHTAKKYCQTEYLARMSVEELLWRLVYFPDARALCRPFISSLCAVRNLNDVSALWFLLMVNGAGGFFSCLRFSLGDNNRYFIEGGMRHLARKLLHVITSKYGVVRYNEPVLGIRYNDDRVYVTTGQRSIKCAVVVVAIDAAQYKSIAIEPALPTAFQTIQDLYTGTENTFFNLTYNQPFWDSPATILASGTSNANLQFMYDATCYKAGINKYVLAGYTDDARQKKTVFDVLNECFDASAGYVSYRKYESSEYSDGKSGFPMSVMKPGFMAFPLNYADSPHDSDYATEWPGTIDGAVEAGENTAYLVLATVRPQALTFSDMTQIMYRKSEEVPTAPFPLVAVQYLGIFLNAAILLSFFRHSFAGGIGNFFKGFY